MVAMAVSLGPANDGTYTHAHARAHTQGENKAPAMLSQLVMTTEYSWVSTSTC